MTDAEKIWTKILPFKVKADNPFDGDMLGRKETCEKWSKFVEKVTTPFTMAIDASWGDGKSVLLEMWRRHMEKEGFCCVFYDAWQCDFYGDAFPTLIGEIQKQIEEIQGKEKSHLIEKLKMKAGKLSKAISLRNVLPHTVRAVPGGEVLSEMLREVSEKFRDHDEIKQYLEYRQAVVDFKEELTNLAACIHEKTGKPLVIFVDELDRCRPNFAIEVLEKIKHLFDIKWIVFVFAINKDELIKTIQTVYGDISGDAYLRKFFDRTISLKNDHNLIKDSDRVGDMDRIHSRYRLFVCALFPEQLSLKQCLGLFANDYNISLRDQEQIVAILNVTLLTAKVDYRFCPVLLTYFATLKFANPELYQESRFAMKRNDIFQLPLEKYDNFHQEHVGSSIDDTAKKIIQGDGTGSDNIHHIHYIRLEACARFCAIRYKVDGAYRTDIDGSRGHVFWNHVKTLSGSIEHDIFDGSTTLIEEIEKIGDFKELDKPNKN